MRHRLPPLNPLRAFEATARHGTVASAAEELNVTASAVSHQVRVLESTLGVCIVGGFETGVIFTCVRFGAL
jgi:LysR family glycine cleavage system transcriptional activator